MSDLLLKPNIEDADEFYADLLAAHDRFRHYVRSRDVAALKQVRDDDGYCVADPHHRDAHGAHVE